MKKTSILIVQGKEITLTTINDTDYISLTDMIKSEEGEDHIRNWMRNKNTIEFLGIWETLNNPDFKGVEFDTFLNEAIKNIILSKLNISQMKQGIIYASEADLLNLALFGCTAKQWQEANPELSKTMNIRDTATINQLIVLSNIESLNAVLIKQGITKEDRLSILHNTVKEQLALLMARNAEQNFAKLESDGQEYIEELKHEELSSRRR